MRAMIVSSYKIDLSAYISTEPHIIYIGNHEYITILSETFEKIYVSNHA